MGTRFAARSSALVCRYVMGMATLMLMGMCALCQTRPGNAPARTDPTKFEVVTVKLYMSAPEAIDALEKKFGLHAETNFSIERRAGQAMPEKPYVHSVSYNGDEFGFELKFAEVFPFDANRREAAYLITYMPRVQTEADQADLRKRVIEKYGAPSQVTDGANGDCWCSQREKTQTGFTCNTLAAKQPYLELDRYALRLVDYTFPKKMDAAYNKMRSGSKPVI